MYYTIYKITNTINNKIYIGKHQTKDLNDLYMGSGIAIKNAIKKYGIECFVKEILFVFDTEEEMTLKESEIVTEEFCLSKDTYNISLGGKGGVTVLFPEHPLYEQTIQKLTQKAIERSDISRKNAIENHQTRKIGMYGRKQSQKQKDAVSKAQRGRSRSPEELQKQRESYNKRVTAEGYIHPNKGRESLHTKDAFTKLPRKICEHCGFETNAGNYGRYHGPKCKQRVDPDEYR